MAAQKKQHYVPQLYMKGFANEKGGISILNLVDYSIRNDVPYKDQCKIDYFYGKDGEWETFLSKRESDWAAVLKKLNCEEPITLAEQKIVREFIVYQRQRTEAEDKSIRDEKAAIIEEAARMKLRHENIPFTEEALKECCKKIADEKTSPGESLEVTEKLVNGIDDLTMMVIHYDTENELVFSDAPVISINPFHHPSIGYGCMGLIMLVPISPHKLLILFDEGVYQVNSTTFYQHSNEEAEVEHLNVLQLISAVKRVMGNSDKGLTHYDDVAKEFRKRNRDEVSAHAFGGEDNRIIKTSMRKCTYPHDWHFVRMKRKAAKIPWICREAVQREWTLEWEHKLEEKASIVPQMIIMQNSHAGMTEKELKGGFQKMATFAREYWQNRKDSKRS